MSEPKNNSGRIDLTASSSIRIATGGALVLFYLFPYSIPYIGGSPHTIAVAISFVLILLKYRWKHISLSSMVCFLILTCLLISNHFAPKSENLSQLRAWINSLIFFWILSESASDLRLKTFDVLINAITAIWSCASIAQVFFGGATFISAWFGAPPNAIYATGLSNFSNSAGLMFIPLLMWNVISNIIRPAWHLTFLWAFGCASLYYTMSRASILGWIVGLIIIAIKCFLNSKKSELRRLILQVCIASLIFLLGWSLPTNLDRYELGGNDSAGRWSLAAGQEPGLIAFESWDDYSRNTRLMTLKVGIKAIAEYPLTGVGMGNFSDFYAKNYKQLQTAATLDDRELMTPHNGYLQLAAENGLPALLVVLSCIVFIALQLMKSSNPLATFALASLSGIALWLLFHDGLYERILWIILAFGVIAFQKCEGQIMRRRTIQNRSSRINPSQDLISSITPQFVK